MQKKIKHVASVTAMCLRSVHSLHLHFVQAFRSFRCTAFTTLSFTPFRLRSFHPPQHRTAKVAYSFRCTNPRSSIPQAVPFPNTQGSGVNKSYHCRPGTMAQSCSIPPRHTRYATFNRHLCFHPPHNKHRYALFFLRHIAPTIPHTNIPFKMVILSHGIT